MQPPAAALTPRSIRVMGATFIAAMLNSHMLSSFAIAILMQSIAEETGWGHLQPMGHGARRGDCGALCR